MVLKVYISGMSGNKEVKKRQQRVLMILDSKNMKYETIDITEPGKENEKDFMQTKSTSNGATVGDQNPRHPLPPQIFNDEEYCGDYDAFDLANELDTLEQFAKLAPADITAVTSAQIELKKDAHQVESSVDAGAPTAAASASEEDNKENQENKEAEDTASVEVDKDTENEKCDDEEAKNDVTGKDDVENDGEDKVDEQVEESVTSEGIENIDNKTEVAETSDTTEIKDEIKEESQKDSVPIADEKTPSVTEDAHIENVIPEGGDKESSSEVVNMPENVDEAKKKKEVPKEDNKADADDEQTPKVAVETNQIESKEEEDKSEIVPLETESDKNTVETDATPLPKTVDETNQAQDTQSQPTLEHKSEDANEPQVPIPDEIVETDKAAASENGEKQLSEDVAAESEVAEERIDAEEASVQLQANGDIATHDESAPEEKPESEKLIESEQIAAAN